MIIITNPFTQQYLVVNHPGHADQSVHGKKRSVAEILEPFGFKSKSSSVGPYMESSLGTKGKSVRVIGERDNEYTPGEVTVEFSDEEYGSTGQGEKVTKENLKFLRKLRGMVAVLDREGVGVTGSPADSKRERVYKKALSSINIPDHKNPFASSGATVESDDEYNDDYPEEWEDHDEDMD